jgi:hypothetical protein
MDADYGRNRDRDGTPSLFVWATVMSRPTEDRAIVDAGLKALAFDSGPPLVCDEPAATYERASDEHGRLGISGATNRLGLGDKIRLVPGHCDPTVNLYDWYVGIRGNRVEQHWPITARRARFINVRGALRLGRQPSPILQISREERKCPAGGSMTKVQIELSEATARAAREAGLLTSEALERLLTDAIRRRQAADALLAIAERVAEAGIEPISMEEIDREVKAVRAERRRRAGGR